MSRYLFEGRQPQIDPTAFAAASADLIGGVILRAQASVWFNAVLRGDNEDILLGPGCNVQDGAVLHTDMGSPLVLAERVSVGHQAMLHGCEVGLQSLIGMQAVILNGAKIGQYCIVGAGALVTGRMIVPDFSLVLGSPAKVVRTVTEEERAMMLRTSQGYIDRIERYRQCTPL